MSQRPHVVAAVFARGGSKGLPGKNVRPLAGKPLVAHSIDVAQASKYVSRVVVSTDSDEIAAVARTWGAEVPFMRPAELAQDDSPEWLAWQHLLRELASVAGTPIDVLVSVPTTSPLRSVQDVDACIDLLLSSDADVVVTVTPANRNPYFNMLVLDEEQQARVVIPTEPRPTRRQQAPEVFDMTTVAYAVRPAFVLSASGLFEGRMRAVVVPAERALDIDTEYDFRLAECLIKSAANMNARP